jgi:predicted nucleic acid-binding protein
MSESQQVVALNASSGAPSPPTVVLDTNAVLDWLVFADPGMAALGAAVSAGTVLWRTHPRMRDELARTLGYATLSHWSPDAPRVLAAFDSLAQMWPQGLTAHPGFQCTDSDDQVFIDLALDCGARWLVTHDRAVLRLARRARARGLQVLRPADWRCP